MRFMIDRKQFTFWANHVRVIYSGVVDKQDGRCVSGIVKLPRTTHLPAPPHTHPSLSSIIKTQRRLQGLH